MKFSVDTDLFNAELLQALDKEPFTWRDMEDGTIAFYAYEQWELLRGVPETGQVILNEDIRFDLQQDYNYQRHRYEPRDIQLSGLQYLLTDRITKDAKILLKDLLGSAFDVRLTDLGRGLEKPIGKLSERIQKRLNQLDIWDKDTIAMCFELFSTGTSASKYNYVLLNADLIKEVKEKLPVAWPWITEFLNSEIYKTEEANLQPVRNTALMRDLKTYVMANWRITPAQWKVMLKMKKTHIDWLLGHGWSHIDRSVLLDHYAKHGKWFRTTAAESISAMFRGNRAIREHIFPQGEWRNQFQREALSACMTALNIKQWANNEFNQIKDWLESPEMRNFVPDNNQRTAKWGWFVREAQKWHDVVALRRLEEMAGDGPAAVAAGRALNQGDVKPKDPRQWESEVYEMKFPKLNLRVIALVRAIDLAVEGHSMAHCVGGYATRCFEQGDSRIFSIRALDTDNRLATAQITLGKSTNKWTLAQISGKRNAEVTPELREVGTAIGELYNETIKKKRDEAARIARELKRAEEDAARALREKEALKKAKKARSLLKDVETNTTTIVDLDEEIPNVG